MQKFIPLISFGVAAIFVSYSAMQFSHVSGNITAKEVAAPPPQPAQPSRHPNEPVHRMLIRCLTDVDDLLDTIRNPASFAAAKPKILNRMRQHVAQAGVQPNQGMARLSKTAAQEMQKAMNRHTEALIRANEAAPGVVEFFQKDVAAVLNGG
jgi:hypothetical protein